MFIGSETDSRAGSTKDTPQNKIVKKSEYMGSKNSDVFTALFYFMMVLFMIE